MTARFLGACALCAVGRPRHRLIFFEARKYTGDVPALAGALVLPSLPSSRHAQWAHSDLASATTLFLVTVALARSLETPRRPTTSGRDWRSLAIAVKLTAS